MGTSEADAEAFELIDTVSMNGKGPGECIGRLARCYRDGRGTEIDLDKAERLMDIAIKKNVIWAGPELDAILKSRKS